jgi:hypothetical protein
MSAQSETVEEFNTRARSLYRRALEIDGSDSGHSRLNRYMGEAKSMRLTWVEGLEYSIKRHQTSGHELPES